MFQVFDSFFCGRLSLFFSFLYKIICCMQKYNAWDSKILSHNTTWKCNQNFIHWIHSCGGKGPMNLGWSVFPSFHPSVRRFVPPSIWKFSWIWSISFFETQHCVKDQCEVVCNRARFFGKKSSLNKNDQKKIKMTQKCFFGTFL